MQAVLIHALASVVYHHAELRSVLPPRMALWHTALFTSSDILCRLQSILIVGHSSPFLNATGIPPHTGILHGLQGVTNAVNKMPTTLIGNIEETLERNGAAAANITPAALHLHIETVRLAFVPWSFVNILGD